MDLPHRSPLVDCFRQGDVPHDVRLLAARGGLTPDINDQLQLLMFLVVDRHPDVADAARTTIARLPPDDLAAFLAGPEIPPEVREFYANRDAALARAALADAERKAAGADEPPPEEPGVAADLAAAEADPVRRGTAQRLSLLSVAERMKAAVQGSREERSVLVRDPNRLVCCAVLSSPKLTESEVESIARMTSVSDEVLRIVGTNRAWTKNYPVVAALARNPKTPVGIALTLLPRLLERDVKLLSTDRNVPEPIRLSARKIYSRGTARRQ